MKKTLGQGSFFLSSFFILLLLLLMGFASVTAVFGAGDELDAAVRELSDYLNKRIPKGTKAVFLNVKSDWPALSEYILDCLQENAVNDEAFSVVDRQQLDAIRSELKFQWSGEVSDKSAQEIGQMFGAQTIVSGLITKVGSDYRIQVRAIAVQTAAVQGLNTKSVSGKGQFVTALTAAPAAPAAQPQIASNDAAAHYNRGKEYYEKKDYDNAIAEFTQALRLDSDYTDAYFRRGATYYMKKDYDKAIADYTQLLRLNPNLARYYYIRGMAYYANKDYDKAIADYNQALRLDPNLTDVYRTRGNAYVQKKDFDRAIADFETLLQIDPNNASAKESIEKARQARGR